MAKTVGPQLGLEPNGFRRLFSRYWSTPSKVVRYIRPYLSLLEREGIIFEEEDV